ncbi:MAG: hypothetical protein OEQ39_12720 [Gammaproteobacteria bacterium]|nr:hypothetical protein [Gammaproteobacteria bacterium]
MKKFDENCIVLWLSIIAVICIYVPSSNVATYKGFTIGGNESEYALLWNISKPNVAIMAIEAIAGTAICGIIWFIGAKAG